MPLSEADFNVAKHFVPTLQAERRGADIIAVTAEMVGIVGRGSTAQRVYKVRVTLDGYPSTAPRAFITEPSDGEIRHINIFRGTAGQSPRVCMGKFDSRWSALSPAERTIMNYFIDLDHVLRNENTASVARP